MAKFWLILIITGLSASTLVEKAQAQVPIIDIIKEATKKAIKAIDLQIQRQQNKVIWLQNAQKAIENTLSKTKLDEISSWIEQQRSLYEDYYDELRKVKSTISYYKRISETIQKQIHLVEEYKRAYTLFKQDKHFTSDEVSYMGKVYTGIIDESIKNLDQLFIVINSFTTQMSDGKRLDIINYAADQIEDNYRDLKRFNRQAVLLSLQRAKSKHDVDVLRDLYGVK